MMKPIAQFNIEYRLVEGFTKVIYPEASNIVVFVIMALVLILRPAGLFGKD